MSDPLSITAVFAFMNSALKFSELAVKLYAVETENGVFVRLIQTVRRDLEETERLLGVPSVRTQLISTPAKVPWIKSVIFSTKSSLNEIGRWVERVRGDKEGYGRVSLENKIRWVFNDHDKLVNRHMELASSHQALSTVLIYLTPLEKGIISNEDQPPDYKDATFLDDYTSPAQRRLRVRSLQKKTPEEMNPEMIVEEKDGSINGTPTTIKTTLGREDLQETTNVGTNSTIPSEPSNRGYHSLRHSEQVECDETGWSWPTQQNISSCTSPEDFMLSPKSTPSLPSSHLFDEEISDASYSQESQAASSGYLSPFLRYQTRSEVPSSPIATQEKMPVISQDSDARRTQIHNSSSPILNTGSHNPISHRLSAINLGPVNPHDYLSEFQVDSGLNYDDPLETPVEVKFVAELVDSATSELTEGFSRCRTDPFELSANPCDPLSQSLRSTKPQTKQLTSNEQFSRWVELPRNFASNISTVPSVMPSEQDPMPQRPQMSHPQSFNNGFSQYNANFAEHVPIRRQVSSMTLRSSEFGDRLPSLSHAASSVSLFSTYSQSTLSPTIPYQQPSYTPDKTFNPTPGVHPQDTTNYLYQSPDFYSHQQTTYPLSSASTSTLYLPPQEHIYPETQQSTPFPQKLQPTTPVAGHEHENEHDHSMPRSTSLMESRRRNQRAMLDVFSHEEDS